MKFFFCSHRHTFIERRELAGTQLAVLHYVCEDCGQARPMMSRSVAEHARVVASTPPVPHAVKKSVS